MRLAGQVVFPIILSFFIGISYASAATEVYGNISENTTWAIAESPYIIIDATFIDPGATLTIEPGVVVKFATNEPNPSPAYTYLVVSGALEVQGTAEDPVYFTSLRDDSVGGDTNGDGSATAPAPRDWILMEVTGPNSGGAGVLHMSHAVVRYAEIGVYNSGGEITVSDSQIENNEKGVSSNLGVTAISSSTITNNEIGVEVGAGAPAADARLNWWGDASGPNHPILNPGGLGDTVTDGVLFDPWTGKVETLDPVVIIPGILGSWEKNDEWIIDPVLHTYDNLIDTFLANGYVEGETLFKFPYDWRSSNLTIAFLLKNKIEEIKSICGCSKVDLIGHSMGGLVATAYIERDDYQNDVDQLFLVATPLKGSPEAYKAWEGSEIEFGPRIQNIVMQMIFKNEARRNGFGVLPNSIFDYIHGWPIASIQELLPVNKNYLSTPTEILEYPAGYPGNLFLEELTANFDAKVKNKVGLQVIRADTLNTGTLDGIVVEPSTQLPKWEHGKPVSDILGAGDGTVPLWSIEDIVQANKEFMGVDHNKVVSGSTAYIFEGLTGETPDPLIDNIYDAPSSFVSFMLFSPIDMQIVAPDGKKLGKDLEGGGELNEIPNAFYSGFGGENEYAIIMDPLPGTYEIKTVGMDDGEYTIVADYSTLVTASIAEITHETQAGEVISHIANLSATTTDINLVLPQEETLTPATCVVDMKTAYEKKWIKKKGIYLELAAKCHVLGELFKTRDKLNGVLQKGVLLAIRKTLDSMDKLTKDKSVAQEGKELIKKYTTWFREHEL